MPYQVTQQHHPKEEEVNATPLTRKMVGRQRKAAPPTRKRRRKQHHPQGRDKGEGESKQHPKEGKWRAAPPKGGRSPSAQTKRSEGWKHHHTQKRRGEGNATPPKTAPTSGEEEKAASFKEVGKTTPHQTRQEMQHQPKQPRQKGKREENRTTQHEESEEEKHTTKCQCEHTLNRGKLQRDEWRFTAEQQSEQIEAFLWQIKSFWRTVVQSHLSMFKTRLQRSKNQTNERRREENITTHKREKKTTPPKKQTTTERNTTKTTLPQGSNGKTTPHQKDHLTFMCIILFHCNLVQFVYTIKLCYERRENHHPQRRGTKLTTPRKWGRIATPPRKGEEKATTTPPTTSPPPQNF